MRDAPAAHVADRSYGVPMAAHDSHQDVERGFGTGLRAQLGKRQPPAEVEASAPEPDEAPAVQGTRSKLRRRR